MVRQISKAVFIFMLFFGLAAGGKLGKIKKAITYGKNLLHLISDYASAINTIQKQRSGANLKQALPDPVCPKFNGEVTIHPPYATIAPFRVYCEGGWIVIARFRSEQFGSDLKSNCSFLQNGYGSLHGEFWLGLEKMHLISRSANYELAVVIELKDGSKGVLKYSKFYVGSENEKYAQHWGNFVGKKADDNGYSRIFTTSRFHPRESKNCYRSPEGPYGDSSVTDSFAEDELTQLHFMIRRTE